MKRAEIVEEARRYVALKTKWRHMGRNERACDCAGLLVLVCRAFDVPHKDAPGNYRRTPEGWKFVDHLKAQFDAAPPEWKPGRIVVLHQDGQPCHTGILGERHGRLTLIHSTAERGCVYEEIWSREWQSRFICALDFPGVED